MAEQVQVYWIAKYLEVPVAQIRLWDGYDVLSDTVELTDEETAGLWRMANKGTSTTKPLTPR